MSTEKKTVERELLDSHIAAGIDPVEAFNIIFDNLFEALRDVQRTAATEKPCCDGPCDKC